MSKAKQFFIILKESDKKTKITLLFISIILILAVIFEYYAIKKLIMTLATIDSNLLFFMILFLIYYFAQLHVLDKSISDKNRQLFALMTIGNFSVTKRNHRIISQNTKETYRQKLGGFEFISIVSYCSKLIMSLSSVLLLFMFHFLLMYSNSEFTNQHAIYILIYSILSLFLLIGSGGILLWRFLTTNVIVVINSSFFREKKINKILKKYNK